MLQKTQGSAVGLFDCKWYWGLLIFCWPCSAADFKIVTVTHWFTGSRVQLQISKNSCQLLRYKGSFAAEPCQKKYSKDFFLLKVKCILNICLHWLFIKVLVLVICALHRDIATEENYFSSIKIGNSSFLGKIQSFQILITMIWDLVNSNTSLPYALYFYVLFPIHSNCGGL